MAGYIGSKASVVSSGAEHKKVFDITTTTTSLTGLVYTPTLVHVFHNGVRLVDGTDYTATSGTTITLTVAAENGDQVVVISYATFQTSDTVSASAGGTFGNNVSVTGTLAATAVTGDGSGLTSLTSANLTGTVTVSGSNVGIGTSSPSTKLHLGGTAPMDSIIRQDSTASGTNWEIGERAAGKWQIWEDDGDSVVATFQSNGKVGIGTSSPSFEAGSGGGLEVNYSAGLGSHIKLTDSASGAGGSNGFDLYAFNTSGYIENYEAGSIVFRNGGTERMRIDSSGSLLVGQTGSSSGTVGTSLRADGRNFYCADGNYSAHFNRNSSDGPIAHFAKDDTIVGSIGTSGGLLTIGTGAAGLIFVNPGRVTPWNITTNSVSDNLLNLGEPYGRFAVIYAGTGSINTSDRNEKQDIDVMSEAETRVAAACKGLMRKFRWKDAVAEKGDDARIHFGIIAQDLQDAFAAEGLDASRYAMFCSDTWWETQTDVPAVEAVAEVLDEEGNVVTEAVEAKEAYIRTDHYDTLEEAPEGATERTRLGVRYSELLAFIIGVV